MSLRRTDTLIFGLWGVVDLARSTLTSNRELWQARRQVDALALEAH